MIINKSEYSTLKYLILHSESALGLLRANRGITEDIEDTSTIYTVFEGHIKAAQIILASALVVEDSDAPTPVTETIPTVEEIEASVRESLEEKLSGNTHLGKNNPAPPPSAHRILAH